jgi:hypothetical protein
MEDQEIISLWKTQETGLEQTMAITAQLLNEIKAQKAQSALRSLKVIKTTGVITGLIYLMILGAVLAFAIAHYPHVVNYFIISVGAIFIINVKAVADYIKHLVWANTINYEGSVVAIQQRLAKLQLSIINHSRIMTLQLPFWTTLCLSDKWFPKEVGWVYIVFQILFTGSATWLAVWLYKNQTLANADKRWFKLLIAGSGGKSVAKALEYYNEIEEFKR